MRDAPEGECTCTDDAEDACEYCYAMNLWAYEQLQAQEGDDEGWLLDPDEWEDDDDRDTG